MDVIAKLKHGLIVSCQTTTKDGHTDFSDPFYGPEMMAAMARAAVMSGAKGIRANGSSDIQAIRSVVDVPIIGIKKLDLDGYQVRITPTFESAAEVVESGADIVALDCTLRPHPGGITVPELIQRIHKELKVPVMADISTFEEGVAAVEAGADIVATTLSGYTPYSRKVEGPDFALLEKLAKTLSVPVIHEGRISHPSEARRALDLGAYAVVVGSMITSPKRITEAYVEALQA